MTQPSDTDDLPRIPLSRRRVLRGAVRLADRDGVDSLTMRKLAQEVGAEAMSLYHHVANKEAVFDGLAEMVLEEVMEAVGKVDGPDPAEDWRAVLRARVLAAREVLLRHRWAPQLLVTRTNPIVVAYYDQVVGILRAGGFSFDLAHRALHVLGSRALGFTQELFQPGAAQGVDAEAAMAEMGDRFPNIVGMLADAVHDDPDGTLGFCDDQFEFEFALDLILDGLERRRAAGS
ncbi:TetR/AcrR family transcriptional regulator C-terminal domain-containing protein [Actinomadura sp. NAK00032]|uniref:TetR/AcrR family transcriptional regulator C-terminal domain-containing protein n=1 Tax=Actinomadura sp. NAK00032 TaxID=2742128 RepID=UPI0015908EB1|nr:TetR/AcrR family transcriptional regulator C-terminal domain-containing protein [Actinomadura sp. NAK00032]QKW32807.1 TetR/AcrR family transcriptional regulator C-terminal domain-containing protein [Actinomadura sp. NAK00032]